MKQFCEVTRRKHSLWETDFNGALKVDFWYLAIWPFFLRYETSNLKYALFS